MLQNAQAFSFKNKSSVQFFKWWKIERPMESSNHACRLINNVTLKYQFTDF